MMLLIGRDVPKTVKSSHFYSAILMFIKKNYIKLQKDGLKKVDKLAVVEVEIMKWIIAKYMYSKKVTPKAVNSPEDTSDSETDSDNDNYDEKLIDGYDTSDSSSSSEVTCSDTED